MTASIRSAAAALLMRQHLSSFYACGVMDLRKFEGDFLIDSYAGFVQRGGRALPSVSLPNGMTLRCPELAGRALILYDGSLSPHRRNFTIAHEIGHCILGHKSEGGEIDRSCERMADSFAAALLMPPVLILAREELTGERMGAEEIERQFAVSRTAALRMREELDAMEREGIAFSSAERALAASLFAPLRSSAAKEDAALVPVFNQRYGL